MILDKIALLAKGVAGPGESISSAVEEFRF